MTMPRQARPAPAPVVLLSCTVDHVVAMLLVLQRAADDAGARGNGYDVVDIEEHSALLGAALRQATRSPR